MRRYAAILLCSVLLLAACMPIAASGSLDIRFEWIKEGFSDPVAAICDDGAVMIADGNTLIKYSDRGIEAWKLSLGGDIRYLEPDSSGGCWATFGRTIVRINLSGRISWSLEYEQEATCLEALPDGRLLVGTLEGAILVDELGSPVWLYDPASACDT